MLSRDLRDVVLVLSILIVLPLAAVGQSKRIAVFDFDYKAVKGDVVQVELPGPAGERRVTETLEGLPGIRDVLVAGRSVSARSDDGAAAVPAVLAALAEAGAPAASVTVARPSLDDLYLRHTGRRYSEGAEVASR